MFYSPKRITLRIAVLVTSLLILLIMTGSRISRAQNKHTTFNIRSDSIKMELQELKVRSAVIAPREHRLHHYFGESIGIIERLLVWSEQDRITGSCLESDLGLMEAEFLTRFLSEEIQVENSNVAGVKNVINVVEAGLRPDGKTNNLEAFQDLLSGIDNNSLQTVVEFPQGSYFFSGSPGENVIDLQHFENLTFTGKGKVFWIFDGRNRGRNSVHIYGCKNLEFCNIHIDMRPLPFTLGEITAIESGNQIVVDIVEPYPLPDQSYLEAKYLRGLVIDPESGRLETQYGDPRITRLEEIRERSYRLVLDDNALTGNQFMTQGFTVGKYFSIHPRQRPSSGNAVSIYNSRHILFSGFHVYASDGHLFGITGSAGIKFIGCDISPGPGRFIMSNADGFHCRSNPKGLYLESCNIMRMNDDCMNFYTKLVSVAEVLNEREFVLLISGARNSGSGPGIQVGSAIAFINANTGAYDAVTSVESLTTMTWGDQETMLKIKTSDPVTGIISRRSSGRPDHRAEREYTPSGAENYRKAMALDAPFEHMVANLNAKNDGFIIRNCHFGLNRATGFKCKASNGVIRNSHFHDQIALFLANLSWWEGTYPDKIEMTDVIFDRGIRFFGGLPGRFLTTEDVAGYMRHYRMERVVDSEGKLISPPDLR